MKNPNKRGNRKFCTFLSIICVVTRHFVAKSESILIIANGMQIPGSPSLAHEPSSQDELLRSLFVRHP